MNYKRMAVSLTPFRTRLSRTVKVREILRVVATLDTSHQLDPVSEAMEEVLIWTQNRSGGKLPPEAWDGKSFEYLAGGRTILALNLEGEQGVTWALSADDPDKTVPGRIWTTEVTIRTPGDGLPQLSIRQLASSSEIEMRITPHVPGLMKQISDKIQVTAGGLDIQSGAIHIGSEQETATLMDLLQHESRRLPVIVASGDERASDPKAPLIDVDSLARATLGLALVVVVPASYTYALSDAFGKVRSVYNGAIRVYLPGFDQTSDPYEHRLFLAGGLQYFSEEKQAELRRLVARESLLRTRLGDHLWTFASVRSAAAKLEQEVAKNSPEADRLKAAHQRIEALTQELDDAKDEVDQYIDLAEEAEERAKLAEGSHHQFQARLEVLQEALLQKGIEPHAGIRCPEEWDNLIDWCDEFLVGRLALAPQARRGIKKADFRDPLVACECLMWLAFEGRQRRIEGGGTLANITINPGIENAHCGSDSFEFDWQGGRMTADWHVKNGGNTRDPRRCLRIYYGFDDVARQIIVADMPGHRRTGAS